MTVFIGENLWNVFVSVQFCPNFQTYPFFVVLILVSPYYSPSMNRKAKLGKHHISKTGNHKPRTAERYGEFLSAQEDYCPGKGRQQVILKQKITLNLRTVFRVLYTLSTSWNSLYSHHTAAKTWTTHILGDRSTKQSLLRSFSWFN